MKVVWLILVATLVGCSRAESDRGSNAETGTDSRGASELNTSGAMCDLPWTGKSDHA